MSRIKYYVLISIAALLGVVFAIISNEPANAATAVYQRVNNQTIKYYYTQDYPDEQVPSIVEYYLADTPQAQWGSATDPDTYFYRVKEEHKDPLICYEYIHLEHGSSTRWWKGSVPRSSEGSNLCNWDAEQERFEISSSFVNSRPYVFFFREDANTIRPAIPGASNSVFQKVRDTSNLGFGSNYEVYVQTQPLSSCPRLLTYGGVNWGFIAPVMTSSYEEEESTEYYRQILRNAGVYTSAMDGCSIESSSWNTGSGHHVRENNESTMATIIGGDSNFWKNNYGNMSFNALNNVILNLGDAVGGRDAAEIVLGEAPEGSYGNIGQGEEQAGEETPTTCAVENVGWIVCPAMNFIADITDRAYDILAENMLQVPAQTVFSGGGATYNAWSTMRSIANVAFVVVFLIIIFSQLTSAGVSNYGVKKMLPRLVVAAILVNVSFWICAIAVDVSNILGASAKSVFTSPEMSPWSYADENAVTQTGNTWGALVLIILAGATLWALGLSVLVPALLMALVTVVTIVAVLALRQALIILLIVVSPLAFVAYLLPNTEGLFKKWLDMFKILLLLFPIIGLLFGAASLASGVIVTSADGSIVMIVVGMLVGIIPLVLVPSLVKGSLRVLGDGASKRLRGLSDKATGGARNKGKSAYEGSRFGKAKAYKKEERALNKALAQGGSYTGRNPLRKAQSRVNAGINSSRMSGSFGDSLASKGAALAAKEEAEAVSNREALMRRNDMDANAELATALENGDVASAKAAQNILFGEGSAGIDKFNETVGTAEKGGKANAKAVAALKQNTKNVHGKTAKDKAYDTIRWANSDKKLSEINSDPSIQKAWGSLSQADLASQTGASLKRGSQHINPETAHELLNNPQLNGNLNPAQREHLEAAASRRVAPDPPPEAGGSGGEGQQPPAQQQAPSQNQSGNSGPAPPAGWEQTDSGLVIPRGRN